MAICQARDERQIVLELALTLFIVLGFPSLNLSRNVQIKIAITVGIPHTSKAPCQPRFKPFANGTLTPDANEAINPIEVE